MAMAPMKDDYFKKGKKGKKEECQIQANEINMSQMRTWLQGIYLLPNEHSRRVPRRRCLERFALEPKTIKCKENRVRMEELRRSTILNQLAPVSTAAVVARSVWSMPWLICQRE